MNDPDLKTETETETYTELKIDLRSDESSQNFVFFIFSLILFGINLFFGK